MLVAAESRDSRFRLLKARESIMEMKQQQFTGNNSFLLGIVLGVITFFVCAIFTQFSANNSTFIFQVVLYNEYCD